MPKERIYFSHDYNARHDRKISALVRDYKSSGYGIFWAVCEMMHEEGGSLEYDELTFSAIAKDLNEDIDVVKTVIEKCISIYKLFNPSDNILVSNRVHRNLDKKKAISTARSEAGRYGAIAKQTQANAKQMLPIAEQTEANVQQNQARKGNKEKEIKEKENNKTISQFPLPENVNGLDKTKIGAIKELVSITKKIDLSESDVSGLWNVFKIQNLTGDKFYQDEGDVYRHFLNWIKKHDFSRDAMKKIKEQPKIIL